MDYRDSAVGPDPQDAPTSRLYRVSTKAAYSRAARDKLVASRSKLDSVNASMRQAMATGRLPRSEPLEKARAAMEDRFAEAERCLARLQKSGDDEWELLRDDVDDAWENLAHAIQGLVSRFEDEIRQE